MHSTVQLYADDATGRRFKTGPGAVFGSLTQSIRGDVAEVNVVRLSREMSRRTRPYQIAIRTSSPVSTSRALSHCSTREGRMRRPRTMMTTMTMMTTHCQTGTCVSDGEIELG